MDLADMLIGFHGQNDKVIVWEYLLSLVVVLYCCLFLTNRDPKWVIVETCSSEEGCWNSFLFRFFLFLSDLLAVSILVIAATLTSQTLQLSLGQKFWHFPRRLDNVAFFLLFFNLRLVSKGLWRCWRYKEVRLPAWCAPCDNLPFVIAIKGEDTSILLEEASKEWLATDLFKPPIYDQVVHTRIHHAPLHGFDADYKAIFCLFYLRNRLIYLLLLFSVEHNRHEAGRCGVITWIALLSASDFWQILLSAIATTNISSSFPLAINLLKLIGPQSCIESAAHFRRRPDFDLFEITYLTRFNLNTRF